MNFSGISCLQNQKSEPSGKLGDLIDKHFGSYSKFALGIQQTGMDHFGSGWVWLCVIMGSLLSIQRLIKITL
jgi:Fe-Mn family superoxide dismutase